jgi:prepilin-type N-terminal cleavage/methylation domain-containing protein
MAVYRSEKGFSLIELMIVVAIAFIIAGFAVPAFLQTMRNFRINGDGVSINGEILTAKMRAAARFTHTRVYFDLASNQFRSQWWDKTANSNAGGWVDETVGAPQVLSSGVSFGNGGVTNDPAGNSIGIAGQCLDDGGSAISNTACVLFNSRGFPIDGTGTITGADEIWITDGAMVYGVTVSINGLTQVWRTDTVDTGGANWIRH